MTFGKIVCGFGFKGEGEKTQLCVVCERERDSRCTNPRRRKGECGLWREKERMIFC